MKIGKHKEAINDYEKLLEVQPTNTSVRNQLAWLLATSSDNRLRDGEKAIKLILSIKKFHYVKKPLALDILAAAYAENGEYSKAIETQEKTIS